MNNFSTNFSWLRHQKMIATVVTTVLKIKLQAQIQSSVSSFNVPPVYLPTKVINDAATAYENDSTTASQTGRYFSVISSVTSLALSANKSESAIRTAVMTKKSIPIN